jgi:predicted nucleic-acid-binding protein
VEAFDTNVVVRLLVEDDEDQCRRAERAFTRAVANGGVFKVDRATTAAALRRLHALEGVRMEDEGCRAPCAS